MDPSDVCRGAVRGSVRRGSFDASRGGVGKGLVLALLAAFATPLAARAGDGEVYGTLGNAPLVKLSELLATPDVYVGKSVRVDGLVTDVCPKRGCWIRIGGDKEFQTVTFKVRDGVMVFPMSAKGKRAQAEGVFTKVELTHEQAVARAQHEAEEKGVSFDPKTVTGPTVLYMLKGTGAVLR